MRRVVILTFLFLFSLPASSQSLKIKFSELVWDFGYIKESEGIVSHHFRFQNNEKFPIEIKQVSTSCGCLIPYISKKIIQPGESGDIKVDYNPEGRPGKFIKSIEITISGNNNELIYFVNMRGVVIEKEVLPAYEENWKYGQLQIKPFIAMLVSSTDYRFLNDHTLQDFINDITYEIDQNHFATVKLELYLSDAAQSVEMSESIFTPLKKFIITELRRRNYTANQIGFADNPYVKKTNIESKYLAMLKISSLDMNNDTIKESGFYAVKDKRYDRYLQMEREQAQRDSALYYKLSNHFYRNETGYAKVDVKDESYQKFINTTARRVLMQGHVNISVRLENIASEKTEAKEKQKMLSAVIAVEKQIIKDLELNGISASKITFGVPSVIIRNSDSSKVKRLVVSNLVPESEGIKLDPSDIILGMNDTSFEKRERIGSEISFKPPFQDLPTYQQYLGYGKYTPDSSRRDFIAWTLLMREQLAAGKKIKFLLECSSSNAPTLQKYDNNYVARKRAKDTETLLIRKLNLNAGMKSNYFLPPVCLVQGPVYDSREFSISFYDKFQYIKIIPLYDTVVSFTNDLFPYQVNFGKNFFELPSNSEIFQVFVNRLIPEIDLKGYIRIIIESSSSYVRSKNFSNNEILSFQRAESAKEKLRAEISKRGYDPRRLIIVEERTLLQGPKPGSGVPYDSPVYEKYQYIKIIPEKLVKE